MKSQILLAASVPHPLTGAKDIPSCLAGFRVTVLPRVCRKSWQYVPYEIQA